MSHVDDGELTAYADGAWPANGPEALRIGEHLSTCANCRNRLELAHELRDRAAEILGYAAPLQMHTPPFESLESQVATSPMQRRRTIPLAWAASIIMALGLGWFGRDFWQNPPDMREVAVQQAPAPADAPAAEELAESDAQQSAAAPGAPARTTVPPQVVATGAARSERAEPARDLAADHVSVEAGRAAMGAVAAAPPPTATALRPLSANETEEHITAAEAERRGLELPRIPELPVARVILKGDTTVVVQTMPDGAMVMLAMTDDAAANRFEAQDRAAAQSGAAREVRKRDAVTPTAPIAQEAAKAKAVAQPVIARLRGKVIVVTGELAPDSLRALSEKIR